MSELSSYIELKKEFGVDERVLALYARNRLLLEIANGFHDELRGLRYDLGGSLADDVEDALVRVLNGYAYEDVVAWLGYEESYGLRWEG